MLNPAAIEALLPKIIAETSYFLGKYNKMENIVNLQDTWGQEGNTFTFPKIAGANATDVETLPIGTDITSDYGVSISGIDATITNENVMRVFIPKMTSMSKKSIIQIVSRVLAMGELKKLEYDIVSLFPSFTTEIGTETGALTEASILQGQIKVDDDMDVGRMVILSPYQYWDKTNGIASFTTQGDLDSGYIGEEIKKTGFVASGYGFDFIISKQIPKLFADPNYSYTGAIMSRSAIGVHTKKIADIELGSIASQRGIEIICTGRWKEAIIEQTEGALLISKGIA